MTRYEPYFLDETGTPKYLPDAASGLETGQTSIAKALTDYFPDAKTYLEGRSWEHRCKEHLRYRIIRVFVMILEKALRLLMHKVALIPS